MWGRLNETWSIIWQDERIPSYCGIPFGMTAGSLKTVARNTGPVDKHKQHIHCNLYWKLYEHTYHLSWAMDSDTCEQVALSCVCCAMGMHHESMARQWRVSWRAHRVKLLREAWLHGVRMCQVHFLWTGTCPTYMWNTVFLVPNKGLCLNPHPDAPLYYLLYW